MANKLREPDKVPAPTIFVSIPGSPNYLPIGAGLLALATHPDKPGDAIAHRYSSHCKRIFRFWQENKAEQEMGIETNDSLDGV